MELSTFFLSLLGIIGLAIFIRVFWIPILVIAYTLYVLGVLVLSSMASAFVWKMCTTPTIEGYWLLTLWFFIVYSIILLVWVCIVCDVADMIGNALTSFIRKTRA